MGHTGTADLPLHSGHCPPWLFERMQGLAAAVVEVMVTEFGPQEVLRRLADPFWFQALGCVLGFDWHSSGLTTTVCAALKEGIRGREPDLGLFIAGGKGKTSLQTPRQIATAVERWVPRLDGNGLIYASRMAAKVDNTALQDGYTLYHHVFIFDAAGNWAVIQQGMNAAGRLARRYHWLGEEVENFVCEPEAAICGDRPHDHVLNMVAAESEAARQAVVEISREEPRQVLREWDSLAPTARLVLPGEHAVPRSAYLAKALHRLQEVQPADFEALLGTEGVGPQTVRALALVAEVAFGAKPSFRDPVRYSFAHGGKDGHPYPVNREQYDRSIEVLRRALQAARIGRTEKMQALRKLAAVWGE